MHCCSELLNVLLLTHGESVSLHDDHVHLHLGFAPSSCFMSRLYEACSNLRTVAKFIEQRLVVIRPPSVPILMHYSQVAIFWFVFVADLSLYGTLDCKPGAAQGYF